MIANPTPVLLDNLYWITLVAVIVSSASGVLKAGFKQFDLFGVIIIAIATGLGGGSLRDILLDRDVFWIRGQMFFIASLGSAIVIFITARLVVISPRLFRSPMLPAWQRSVLPEPWCRLWWGPLAGRQFYGRNDRHHGWYFS